MTAQPLRHSAYTAHHVASADRFTRAVLNAAGVWHDASRSLTDAENALANAREDGDDVSAAMLEYDRASRADHAEYAYQQVRTLVCGFRQADSWEGLAANGHRYRVVWSGPTLALLSIVPQN